MGDLAFFARAAEPGTYRLRPEALNSYQWTLRATTGARDAPAVPGAEYLRRVRGRLDPPRLRDLRGAALGDDTLAAAVISGIVANPEFLDIVDGLLVRASCLCCYRATTRRRAEEAERQIRTLLGYYSQESYEQSNGFYRLLCALLRDATRGEVQLVPRHGAAGADGAAGAAGAAVAALGRAGICAVTFTHAPHHTLYGAVWAAESPPLLATAGISFGVYSTPEGRRALRRLGKLCRAAGLTLSTRIAADAGYGFFCLRHKLRVYAVEVCAARPAGAADDAPAPGLDVLWRCVAAAAKKRAAAPQVSGGDASRPHSP